VIIEGVFNMQRTEVWIIYIVYTTAVRLYQKSEG